MLLISVTEFVGRFHPVLVHLPIGILLVALLLLWLSRVEKYRISHEVIKVVLLTGMFTAILSCITGYLLSLNGDYEGLTVALHMWMGIGVTAASLLLCAKVLSKQFDMVYKITAIALFFLIIITGHLGGSLTHGENYLTAALSNVGDENDLPPKVIPDVQQAYVYADMVQPVLQSKCYSCHGPHKQKGGLRMDDTTRLLKGGEDGAVIVRGHIHESDMVKRMLLPKDDDDHMPPRQKPQLNDRQLALLQWWISVGAPFDKKVIDLPQPDSIRSVLIRFQSDHMGPKMPATIPDEPVAAADEKAIQALRDRGVVVLPVAQNSHYLSVNFVTATAVTNKEISLLLPLKDQLVWLKMNETNIGDEGLKIVSQCTRITELYLNQTAITNKGLAALASLSQLQVLSLVGTAVSAEGLESIASLKKLRALYLYHTKVDGRDWSMLKKKLPKTKLDSGGYSIPFLPTDTAIAKVKTTY